MSALVVRLNSLFDPLMKELDARLEAAEKVRIPQSAQRYSSKEKLTHEVT
jgi:hypothetical protein